MCAKVPPPGHAGIRLRAKAVIHLLQDKLSAAARALKDPKLPFILICVVGVCFLAALILKVSGELVFGLLLVGFLTAFLETISGNDDHDR
jgi:uncharacterized membrane protein YdjX (TVP38/TMEM64 family)